MYANSTPFHLLASVPQQRNGFDCGLYVCMYAYAVYQIRHRPITYSDLYLNKTPCSEAITEVSYFQFTSEEITGLRQQIAQLIDYLVIVYKNVTRKPPDNRASTDTATAAQNVLTENDPIDLITPDDSNTAHTKLVTSNPAQDKQHTTPQAAADSILLLRKEHFYKVYDPIYRKDEEGGTKLIRKA